MKVLLADDEVLTLSMMENLIDWEALSLEIIGKATDGLQALDMIAEQNPDILITDIRMPRMDGLELIKSAHAIYPDLKMIILSAYDEFHYAKEALKYGVMGYLLKPVNEEELITLLQEAVLEVKRLRKVNEQEWINQEMHTEIMLRKLLLSEHRSDLLSDAVMKLNHTFEAYPYRLVSFRIEGNSYEEQLLSINQIQEHEINLHCSEGDKSHLIWNKSIQIHEDEWVVLIQETEYDATMQKLKLSLMQQNTNQVIGISKVKTNWEQLGEAYRETVEVTRLRFYFADQIIFDSEALLQDREEEPQNWNEMSIVEEITAAIASSNIDKGQMLLNRLFISISDAVGTEPEKMYELCYNMIMYLRMRLWELKWDRAFLYVKGIHSSGLHQHKTWIELKMFMSEMITNIMDLKENHSANGQLVDKAKWYISKHYTENITLDAICGFIAVSKNYFCSLFKKETGMSVWDYVTELRMEQAKKLVVQTTMKNYEISIEIGYDNPSYFTKMFKKATGYSPNEYRVLVKSDSV